MKRAIRLKLPTKRGWLKLIHYDRTLFGGYRGQVDNRDFYISKDGNVDPEAEMRATLKALFDPAKKYKDKNEHPYCRFPARAMWLKKHLKLKRPWPNLRCVEWDKFRKRASAQSASLVFSSYYLNSPQSAFGHTFLRLNKGKGGRGGQRDKYELLDNGINYAANRTTNNPLFFAMSGLFGWTDGTWSMVPYYYKVREYNDYELRDLWAYDLALKDSEMKMLVAHLWEMGPTKITYYYFTENCAFHMLTVLEAAAPRLNLIDDLPWWVIPADTVVAVAEEKGLVKNISYRPSVRTKFNARTKAMSTKNKNLVKKMIKERNIGPIRGQSKNVKRDVLDTTIEYIEMTYPEDLLKQTSPTKTWKRELLLARAALKTPSRKIRVPKPKNKQPDLGHGSRRATINFGYSDEEMGFLELNPRFAYHDLLDWELGYPSNAQMEMGTWSWRYNEETGKGRLEEFSFAKVMSINTASFLRKSDSWHVNFGARTLYDNNCNRCLAGVFDFGKGRTWELWPKFYATAFGDLSLAASKGFNDESEWRFGIGPRIHFYYNLGYRNKLILDTYYHFLYLSRSNQYFQSHFEYRHNLYMNSGISLKAMFKNKVIESSLAYHHFF